MNVSFAIRTARPKDADEITSWTQDTFSWGDYVPARFLDWLGEEHGVVLVATVGESPVGLVHALMLSATEGWLSAARVHPDHRRQGLGNALNDAGVAWATENGARVVRLAIEADNEPPAQQVRALGFRQTSSWVSASGDPAPSSSKSDIQPAGQHDVDAAWMFWSSNELHRAGRGLSPSGWQWRQARPSDLTDAAREGRFLQSRFGWLTTRTIQDDELAVEWLATTADDALGLFQSLTGHCADLGITKLNVKAPNLPWLTEALVRTVGQPSEILIFAKGVGFAS